MQENLGRCRECEFPPGVWECPPATIPPGPPAEGEGARQKRTLGVLFVQSWI